MIPPVADYLYTQITGAVGLAGYYTEVTSSGLSEYNAEITQMIKDAGVMMEWCSGSEERSNHYRYFAWNNDSIYYR